MLQTILDNAYNYGYDTTYYSSRMVGARVWRRKWYFGASVYLLFSDEGRLNAEKTAERSTDCRFSL